MYTIITAFYDVYKMIKTIKHNGSYYKKITDWNAPNTF